MASSRVVCGVDFSATSRRAVDYAFSLASRLGAELHLVHAAQMPVYAFPDGAVILGADVVADLTDDLQHQLDAIVASLSGRGVEVVAHLVQGPPEREVVRVAGELGADLLVLGTHGRTGISHFVLGSVAERIVRASAVPVVTVPPRRGGAGRTPDRDDDAMRHRA